MGSYDSLSSLRAAMVDVYNSVDPYVLLRTAQGIVAETCPRATITGGGAMVSGTVYYMQIELVRGQILTTSHIVVGTAGSAVTFAKIGLYDTAGLLLASTADQTSAWATVGVHSQAFTAPYTVPTTGLYYAAWLCVASTTVPASGIASAPQVPNVGNGVAAPSGGLVFGSLVSQVDLPASGAIAAGTAPALIWVGFS